MDVDKSIIQHMKESGDFTQIKEGLLRTYYTCVRYKNVKVATSLYGGPMGTSIAYYGPGQWSCMKGWFEPYDNTFKQRMVEFKVVNYCKFRNTDALLEKDLGESFTMFHPRSK